MQQRHPGPQVGNLLVGQLAPRRHPRLVGVGDGFQEQAPVAHEGLARAVGVGHAGEAAVAKIASLVVKVGALAFILFLPTQYALDLQLLGGLWILQTFPALVFGLFTRWFRAEGLLFGWAVGMIWGSWTAWSNGLKPIATIDLGGGSYMFYVGLGALILNVAVAVVVTVIVGLISPNRAGVTARS